MPDVYETSKPLVEPFNPAAGDKPVVSGVATVKTGETLESREAREAEPLTVVESKIFDGLGGFLAVEDRKRGLMKAFGGDKVVTLSDGSKYVIAKELMDAGEVPAKEVTVKKTEVTVEKKEELPPLTGVEGVKEKK